MTNVAIFCSGSGSNAEALMAHFENHKSIRIALLITNKSDAFALKRAEKFGVITVFFSRNEFNKNPENIVSRLKDENINFVLLAGFLQLIPEELIDQFPDRILNIHPALLPEFGGAGMYGHHVHEAVKEAGKLVSGLTIHLVNKEYDKGKIIFQARCRVDNHDSADDIAARILKMEHAHYPLIAEYFINTSTQNQSN